VFQPFEADAKDSINTAGYWPSEESKTPWVLKFVYYYKMWMLVHCVYILAFCVARVAFEEKPWIYVVYLEVYLDFVFLLDMVRIFNSPVLDKMNKPIYKRVPIFKKYLGGWFWFDLFAFFPLAYFRYNSTRE